MFLLPGIENGEAQLPPLDEMETGETRRIDDR
jgi:hypothetical protein